jgi:hypothetical protein
MIALLDPSLIEPPAGGFFIPFHPAGCETRNPGNLSKARKKGE